MNGYLARMGHKWEPPPELGEPGITGSQAWGIIAASVVVGALFGCLGSAYAGLIAAWVVQVLLVLGLCVQRRRRAVAAYHRRRRHGR